MPKTLAISINLGSGFSGLSLYAQLIRTNGTNLTSLVSDGFYEVGEGFYIWEYSNFPENFRGGVKFYNQADTSKVLSFIDVTTEDFGNCASNSCNSEIGTTFDITYNDQPSLNFYALLFYAADLTKAWNPTIKAFETYTLADHSNFVLSLTEDINKLGWYSYNIIEVDKIPSVIGNQYYFIEIWHKLGTNPSRTADLNTGNLRVCWGAQEGEWLEIAKRVWEYGTRTLTGFDGITPQQIWEYSVRELTSSNGGTCDFTELEKNILTAIAVSTGKTLDELAKVDSELSASMDKTFQLLKTCCSAKSLGKPTVQSPRIGPRGSTGRGPDMRFK